MELYHVLNRGVDKRNIFLDNQDHFRFIHDLFEFNDEDWVNTTFYSFKKNNDIANRKIEIEKKKRKFLVNVHLFCLMPNHYHLLLSPVVENGIPKFMHKLNKGYSRYFNERRQRKGTLFESSYKSILIKNDPHFIHLPYYIHLNPLDLISPEWRNGELKNFKKAIKFLESYRWSSHLDYWGKKNFPSVTQRNLLLKVFGGEEDYKDSIISWLKELNFETIKDIALE